MIIRERPPLTDLIAPGSPTTQKIIKLALKKGLQLHDAYDIAQETALRSLHYAEMYPERCCAERIVIAIAKNCVMDEHRRRNQKRNARTYADLDQMPVSKSREPQDAPTREDVGRRLAQIDPRTKEIAIRRLIDRESWAQIADRMRMSKSAVRSRLYRLGGIPPRAP